MFDKHNQGCLTTLIGGTIFLLLKTIIFKLFWSWFVMSIFPVPEITFIQSIGLMIFLDFLRFGKAKKDNQPEWLFIIDVVFNLVILLSLGFLIHLILC
jgi:hypothetical protein